MVGNRPQTIMPFMVFSVRCVISVTHPILRHMLGYTYDQQLHHYCHLMTLDVQVHLA